MLSVLKTTLRNTIIYSIGTSAPKLAGFILFPFVYAKYFSIEEYGCIGILDATSVFLITLFGFLLYYGYFRWACDPKYKHKAKELLFTTSILVTISALILIGIFIFFSKDLSFLIFESYQFDYTLTILSIGVGFDIIFQMPVSHIRVAEKPILYTTANVVKMLVSLSMTVYFVVLRKHGIEAIYEAYLISQFVFLILIIPFWFKNMKFSFEWMILKQMFLFVYPMSLSAIAVVVINNISPYILQYFNGLRDVGLFSLGYRIANIIGIFIVASVNLAISPIMLKKMYDADNKRFYSKILKYYTFGLMFFVMGLSFFSKEFVKLYALNNPKFWDAHLIIPIVSLGILFLAMKDTVIIGLQIIKKTRLIAWIVFAMAVLSVGLNILLVPLLADLGAAIVLLIVNFSFFIISFFITQKNYPVPYENSRIIKMILIGIAFYGIVFLINDCYLFIRIFVKTSLIIIFPIVLYFLDFYEEVELNAMKNWWIKWKNPKKWLNNLDQTSKNSDLK